MPDKPLSEKRESVFQRLESTLSELSKHPGWESVVNKVFGPAELEHKDYYDAATREIRQAGWTTDAKGEHKQYVDRFGRPLPRQNLLDRAMGVPPRVEPPLDSPEGIEYDQKQTQERVAKRLVEMRRQRMTPAEHVRDAALRADKNLQLLNPLSQIKPVPMWARQGPALTAYNFVLKSVNEMKAAVGDTLPPPTPKEIAERNYGAGIEARIKRSETKKQERKYR